MSSIIIAVAIIVILYLLSRRFSRPAPRPETVVHTRILVSSLGREAGDDLEEKDAAVYSKYYRRVDVAKAQKAGELLASVRAGYDVVHLFCEISGDGYLVAEPGSEMNASDLLKACGEGDVKVLFLAEANPGDNYTKAFPNEVLQGTALNFVMTLDRKGGAFPQFLGALLLRMSSGDGMPLAWHSIAPQIPDRYRSQEIQPGLILFIGRGGVKLLP